MFHPATHQTYKLLKSFKLTRNVEPCNPLTSSEVMERRQASRLRSEGLFSRKAPPKLSRQAVFHSGPGGGGMK